MTMTGSKKNLSCKFAKGIHHYLIPRLPLYGALLVIQSIQLYISSCFIEHIGIGLVFGTIAWTYILSLPQNIIDSKSWRGIYACTILIASSLSGLLELFCAIKLEELVSATHILLISYSNMNESVEFISMFVDYKFSLIVLAVVALASIAYQLMRRIKSSTTKSIITIISLIALIITIFYGTWFDCGIGRVIYAMKSLEKIQSFDLNKTQQQYEVCETSSFHPNIILIIGESFDKNHSSLYGYDKETNPLLYKRYADSTLIAIPNVQSPAPNTHLAIRQMLTLAERHDDELWYKKPVLLSALSKCGYHTCWLSNQAPAYESKNYLGSFARLSDKYYCIGKVDFYDISYDEKLFMPLMKYITWTMESERNFCIIHLAGSHFRYEDRYPKSFSIFHDSDYPNQKVSRRNTFASYDNSILYNDFVVDSLMSITDSLEAIVIYTPDHGQDFYYTRDIAAHGSDSDPTSFQAGCQIPFMIYFTKSFRDKHPKEVERTKYFTMNGFNTKYLMNTIMDMAGYDICDSTILDKSLFRGKFSEMSNATIAIGIGETTQYQ